MRDETLKMAFRPNESPSGFRIVTMEDTSPLKVMGLKEGDVITGVNGKTSNIKAELTAGIEALQTSGTPLQLTIDRGGKPEAIKWTTKLPVGVQQPAPPKEPAAGGARRGG